MQTVEIKSQLAKRILKGYPLIHKEDLTGKPAVTSWVRLTHQGKFLAVGYLAPQNKGAGWVVSFQDQVPDHSFLTALFTEAASKRSAYFADETTTAFRLFNGEGDGLGGVTVDYYENFVVVSWYNEGIYQLKEAVLTALKAACPFIKGIYEKHRFETTLPESRFVEGEVAPEPLIVKENGVQYATYLDDGLMTGIFLDQKEVRGRLAEGMAAGKSVLNLFSYTGAFSVAAAIGGAEATTSVDLAKRSLPKTQEQFMVNGLPLEQQKIIVMDVFEYFKYAKRKELSYDVIVLDPPSFARNKKRVFSVAKNYGDLVEASLDILTAGGTLIASTNAANINMTKYQQMVEDSLTAKGADYHLEEVFRLPGDFAVWPGFAEGNYLKVLVYTIN